MELGRGWKLELAFEVEVIVNTKFNTGGGGGGGGGGHTSLSRLICPEEVSPFIQVKHFCLEHQNKVCIPGLEVGGDSSTLIENKGVLSVGPSQGCMTPKQP